VNNRNGDHSGSGFVRFNNIETATAAKQAINGTQTAKGETIIVNFAKPPKLDVGKPGNHKPNERLYFRGVVGDVSEIRILFQAFSDSIKDITLCMLFTFYDSVTHMVKQLKNAGNTVKVGLFLTALSPLRKRCGPLMALGPIITKNLSWSMRNP
jgi:hypothetical protein